MQIIETNAVRPNLIVIECDCGSCFPHLVGNEDVECRICHRKADLSALEKVVLI